MTWTIRIPKWKQFQHYGKARPPWVKVHRPLLDKRAWRALGGSAAKLLVDLWLLAAEGDDQPNTGTSGEIRLSLPDLAWRLRVGEGELRTDLETLATFEFVELSSATLEAFKASPRGGSAQVVEVGSRGTTTTTTVADATARENVYRTILPLVREHLWKPDGVCPSEIKGKPWSEGQEGTVIRELHKTYSVSDLEVVVLGLGTMLRGLAEDERPDWLPLGAKCSLRAVYHTRSGVVQMVEKCQRAYWLAMNRRPKQARASAGDATVDLSRIA